MKILLKSGKEVTGKCTPLTGSVVEIVFESDVPDPEELIQFSLINDGGKVFGEYSSNKLNKNAIQNEKVVI